MTRLIANVKKKDCDAIRLMICNKGDEGVYLFGYTSQEDSPSSWDRYFENVPDAKELGRSYGVDENDWKTIAQTQPNCQDDWINPVRIKGRNNGTPQWGKFEKLVSGEWIDM